MLRRRYDPCRIPLLGRIYKRYICLEFYYRGAVMGVGDVGDSCILSTRGVATGERGVILGLTAYMYMYAVPRKPSPPSPRFAKPLVAPCRLHAHGLAFSVSHVAARFLQIVRVPHRRESAP